MKNVKLLVLVLALLMLLAGCGNKTAKVSNASEAIFSVGKITFTKGDLYETLKLDDTAYTVINEAGRLIAHAEIETTDAITKEATSKIDAYKEQFGDDFIETIQGYGYADEEDLYNALITSIKSEQLIDKYIEENKESLYAKYSPVLAKLLYVEVGTGTLAEAEEKAKAAYDMIAGGASFDDAAELYATNVKTATESIYTTDDDIDLNVSEFLKNAKSPTLSNAFVDKSSKGFYVVQVTGTSTSAVESKFITYLKSNDSFTADVDHYYFQKHNFKIYDVDINKYVKELFPNYLPESK